MRWWRARKDRESDLDRELRDHLDLESEEQQDNGLSESDAQRAALRVFGNTTSIKEDVREAWGWTWLERCRQDLRYALRILLRRPAFTVVAVLTLGLGIGATTAALTQVDAIFFKPLPAKNPDELQVLSWMSPSTTLCRIFLCSTETIRRAND